MFSQTVYRVAMPQRMRGAKNCPRRICVGLA